MSSKLREAMRGDGTIHGLVDIVRPRMRRGETMFDTVQRLLLHDALHQKHYHQGDAAEMLETTAATISRKVHKFWPEGGNNTARRRQVYRQGLRVVG